MQVVTDNYPSRHSVHILVKNNVEAVSKTQEENIKSLGEKEALLAKKGYGTRTNIKVRLCHQEQRH
jgi:hypothetical protein